MANLKEIRTRLMSVKSTRQITNAMKMVSAAKLRKAQDNIIHIRPYTNKLNDILRDLDTNLISFKENIFFKERKREKVLLVVVTSNRGLCGTFNSNVIKRAMQIVDEKYRSENEGGNLDIIAIGKKGKDFLKSKKYNVIESYIEIFDMLQFSNALPIARKIIEDFANDKYSIVEIIYNQFKNAAVQILIEEQFLPIAYKEKALDRFESITEYLLEPTKEYIIQEIIPKSLQIQFFKILLDSNASEHGARMTAMHQATDNATELIRDLQLEYNKARQASITKEILEIVGGAEALNE